MNFDQVDIKHYCDTVIARIRRCSTTEATVDEAVGFQASDPAEKNNVWLNKALVLLQQFIYQEQYGRVFEALVTLKSVYRNSNLRLRDSSTCLAHKTIDDLIKAFIAEEFPMRCRSDCYSPLNEDIDLEEEEEEEEEETEEWHAEHTCTVNFLDFEWTSFSGGALKVFWDIPMAVRTLRAAYDDKQASKDDELCVTKAWGYTLVERACFHKSSLPLLEWLQKRAWSEVRVKIMLTIGTVLPTELAQRVFECAMEAEDLPIDPQVEETIMVNPPDPLDELQRVVCKIDGPRPFTRTKPVYHCSGLNEPKPESVFNRKL